jgi:P-type conjugative transfer protein TrbJ
MKAVKVIAAVCMLSVSSAANAGGGGLTGGATEWTQMANNAELIKQVEESVKQVTNQITQITNQVTQITNQITMIQDMVLNTLALPNQIFKDVKGVYSKVQDVIGKSRGLAYNMSNFGSELERRFQSYADMGNLSGGDAYASAARSVINTQMETVHTTMEAVSEVFNELGDDASALEELQQSASSAQGRNQIMQATNELLAFLGQDAMKLRQLQMMATQMTGAVYEAERAKNDLGQRHMEQFMKPAPSSKANIKDEHLIDKLAGE